MKLITISLITVGLIYFSDLTHTSRVDDCHGCEYDLKFVKTINGGDDAKYELKCKSAVISYDVYKRKNGLWERLGSSKQFEKCELIKERCGC